MISTSILSAQKLIPLYEGGVPNAKPCNEKDHEFIDTSWMKPGILVVDHITKPTITVFEPTAGKRTKTAVIICPGGGYGIIAAGHEGADVAKVFNNAGVTAFVLRYRLPKDECMNHKEFVPLMDAQQVFILFAAMRSNTILIQIRSGSWAFLQVVTSLRLRARTLILCVRNWLVPMSDLIS